MKNPPQKLLGITALLAIMAVCTCATKPKWGAACSTSKDCGTGLTCHQRYVAKPDERRFCSKDCKQSHGSDDCPTSWHCEPEPYDPRDGQCEPDVWPP